MAKNILYGAIIGNSGKIECGFRLLIMIYYIIYILYNIYIYNIYYTMIHTLKQLLRSFFFKNAGLCNSFMLYMFIHVSYFIYAFSSLF